MCVCIYIYMYIYIQLYEYVCVQMFLLNVALLLEAHVTPVPRQKKERKNERKKESKRLALPYSSSALGMSCHSRVMRLVTKVRKHGASRFGILQRPKGTRGGLRFRSREALNDTTPALHLLTACAQTPGPSVSVAHAPHPTPLTRIRFEVA